MTDVDIIRTSASRPLFLRLTTESWRERLSFSGKLRWIVHEDTLNAVASTACIDYVKGPGCYDRIGCNAPPIGQAKSLTWLWKQAETKYVLSVEDDWLLLEHIDLDRMCALMDAHPEINQIAFFKRPLMEQRHTYVKRSKLVDGIWLTSGPHWAFTPALCRREWLVERWNPKVRPIHHGFQHVIKWGAPTPLTADWTDEHMGTYFLGKIGSYSAGDPRTGLYVQHLGTLAWSARVPTGDPNTKIRYPYSHPNLYYGDMFLRPEES